MEKTGWIKRNGEDGKVQTKRNGGHLERTLVELQLKILANEYLVAKVGFDADESERTQGERVRTPRSFLVQRFSFEEKGLETRLFNSVQRHVCLKDFRDFCPRVLRDVI